MQTSIRKDRVNPVHRAVYALSADPITYGHINVVERISSIFDEVIFGVGNNPAKNYLFSVEERLTLARASLSHLPNVKVIHFNGMLVDFAVEQGAQVIVKGVRNQEDFNYEQLLHQVGASQELGIDTHILFADPKLAHVSSSVVKGIQFEHGLLNQYVPLPVKAALENKISDQIVIGVTGEIAAGKSTFCKTMVEMANVSGIEIHHIDGDALGHYVLHQDQSELGKNVRRKIVDLLGADVMIDGEIDRKKIAEKVFASPVLMKELNELMSKPIMIQLRKSLHGKRGVILLESALLAETEMLSLCNNRVVLMEVDKNTQAARLENRGYSDGHAEKRCQSQFDLGRKRKAIELAILKNSFGRLWICKSGDLSQGNLREIVEEFKTLKVKV
jgi:pantetheine-phosphate adenylyltransferase